jgi:hypothetical protein
MRLARTHCPTCEKDVACKIAYDPVLRSYGDGTVYTTRRHRAQASDTRPHRAEVDVLDVYWPDFPEPTKGASE